MGLSAVDVDRPRGGAAVYDRLGTTEDAFRLGSYVGNAAVSKPINNIWK
jgi:hypothetical protein